MYKNHNTGQITFEVFPLINFFCPEHESKSITETSYSRTLMARTLLARLPRLVRTHSWVPWNKFHSCRFGII